MTLVVIDLEYNQPSRRIIQIGAVEVHVRQGKIEPLFRADVNPEEPLDDYIIGLTGISEERAQAAQTLSEVAAQFWEPLKEKEGLVIGGWGNDVHKLASDCKNLGITMPEFRAVDLSAFWMLLSTLGGAQAPRSKGLRKMMHFYGLEFEGQHHDAFYDAQATGQLILKMSYQLLELIG